MTPEAAKEEAIKILRKFFDVGKRDLARQVFREFGERRFRDIPAEHGHILHYRTQEVAREAGVEWP